jgi:hypothetical protein
MVCWLALAVPSTPYTDSEEVWKAHSYSFGQSDLGTLDSLKLRTRDQISDRPQKTGFQILNHGSKGSWSD